MSTVEIISTAGTTVEIIGGYDMVVEVMDVGAQGPAGQDGSSGLTMQAGVVPNGVKDGVNPNFTLPYDAPFLLLALRGRVLKQDFDFTRNGINLQMVPGNEPFVDDPFLAFLIGDQP